MGDYKERNVYQVNLNGEAVVYLWQGQAIDECRTYGVKLESIRESVLKYRPEQEIDLLNGEFTSCYSWGYHYHLSEMMTEFPVFSDLFLTREEASRSLKGVGESVIQRGWGNTFTLVVDKPATPEWFTVKLKADRDGKLFTNIVSHPEIEGATSKGKIFFPDRSWTDAVEGWAKVKIVREKETYGFIKGESFPDRLPTYQEVLDWAWECEAVDVFDELYTFTDNDTVISYAWEDCKGAFQKLVVNGLTGKIESTKLSPDEVRNLMISKRFKHEMFILLYTMDAYGLNRQEANDLFDDFKESKFYENHVRGTKPRLNEVWLPDTYRALPKNALGDAVKNGWIRTATVDGYGDIQVYTVDWSQLKGLLNVPLDEFREVALLFKEANAAADDLITRKAQHGKIHMVKSRW